jgi:hypothetical protein
MSGDDWLHDRFADLLGFSEENSVEYVIIQGISRPETCIRLILAAKNAKSSLEILQKLTGFGFPSSSSTNLFAQELFERYSARAKVIVPSFLYNTNTF